MEDPKSRWTSQAQRNKEHDGKEWAAIADDHGAYCTWPVSRLSKNANVVYRTDEEPVADIDPVGWNAAMKQLRDKFEGGLV